jgi:hypothetical protein
MHDVGRTGRYHGMPMDAYLLRPHDLASPADLHTDALAGWADG